MIPPMEKNTEADNSFNAVEREPVSTRSLNPKQFFFSSKMFEFEKKKKIQIFFQKCSNSGIG